ncbi:MAG: EVE domain-containing protein [Polyangiaceae bacterium]
MAECDRMNYWLVKSEPSVYPWSKLVKDGVTTWDGVRNFEARNNLRAMEKGDLALFYHSNEGKEMVGIARVKKTAYPDASAKGEDWSAVDLEPVTALSEPVTLAAVKAHPTLSAMLLVKRSRISVVPVTAAEFREILKLSKTKWKA